MAEKKTLSFGFSKVKTKTTIVQTVATQLLMTSEAKSDKQAEESAPELITSIVGRKVQSLDPAKNVDKNKPLVIPCAKNKPVFDVEAAMAAKKQKAETNANVTVKPSTSSGGGADADAYRALLAEANQARESANAGDTMQIPLAEADSANKDEKSLENVEEPNYESVDLEKFGMAAL